MNPQAKEMMSATPALRRCVALGAWAAFLLVFLVLGVWNVSADRREAENRLSSEAGRIAAQLAGLLSVPAWELDELTARTIVMAAMEDQTLYAVKVQTARGLLEGQRRNYQWEVVPWDGEIEENSVQGMNPLKVEGRPVGSVEVYLSPRLTNEELALKARREVGRFCICALCITAALGVLLWYWGDLELLRRCVLARFGHAGPEEPAADAPAAGVVPAEAAAAPSGGDAAAASPSSRGDLAAGAIVSAELGRAFLMRRPGAWRITAGLFGQTFAHAPDLLARLLVAEDTPSLCRLADVLEHAAPSVGAERLAAAAHALQTALNDTDSAGHAVAVEDCVLTLREVLAALGTPGSLRETGRQDAVR